jgi:hypothetical protein
MMSSLVRQLENKKPEIKKLKLPKILDTLKKSIRIELSLQVENASPGEQCYPSRISVPVDAGTHSPERYREKAGPKNKSDRTPKTLLRKDFKV